MLIEAAPLLLLFELSLILARLMGTPGEASSGAEPEPPGTPAS
jgi:Sec-independent protein secretion pathway component TatC